MGDHSGTCDQTVIDQQVVIASGHSERVAWKEAVRLEGRAGQMLAVATVAEIL